MQTNAVAVPKTNSSVVANTKTIDNSCKLIFCGKKANVTKAMLMSHFQQFGQVLNIKQSLNPTDNQPNGQGCITFSSKIEALNALKRPSHSIDSSTVSVRKLT